MIRIGKALSILLPLGTLLVLSVTSHAAEADVRADWLLQNGDYTAAYTTEDKASSTIGHLGNGLLERRFLQKDSGLATVGLRNPATGKEELRGVKPEATITIDGHTLAVGGLEGQPNYAFLTPEWLEELTVPKAAMRVKEIVTGPIEERFPWKAARHHAPDVAWPPKGVHLRMDYVMPEDAEASIQVSVHYELYDGLPVMSKWITVTNAGEAPVRLDHFTSEVLAVVERGAYVEDRGAPFPYPNIHVETDYAFGGMTALNTSSQTVHWVPDPDYETQVNYKKLTPCLLEVRPEIGPGVDIAPGETFESFRTFLLVHDSTDRERMGLAQRRMYRTIAPWVTENPLMMHVRHSNPKTVREAIDQCAEVGFEMAILTFGSGFNIENDRPSYVAEMKELADYAENKGVELGGYSLLASRSIDAENDVVMPEGMEPTFGNSPCLGSEWGEDYFQNLYDFYAATGFDLLEHDGSYPGDPCTSTSHPGHRDYDDSQWTQWRTITEYYQWCRARGIYLNVPDYYYLSGSNKCGMGYRETNWSLPRAQQVIHTRQNIYDGTWEKTPSMGWMFVPLTEYHGGGEAATIEPLEEHLDHYDQMLFCNLAMGVQACYRGPRLYDTDETRDRVKAQVDWFKKYRDILESDVVHGRRADGRGLDWMLHVNPNLKHKGMLVVFNPLDHPVEQTLNVNLYYTGLDHMVRVSGRGSDATTVELRRDYTASIPVSVAAGGYNWYVIE